MTGERFAQCLELLHWSRRVFGEIVLVDERQVRRWLVIGPPERVGDWLEGLASYVEAHPVPMPDREA